MKLLLFVILLTNFPFCTGKKESVTCEKFRNGNFILTMKPGGTRYEIERKDSVQTEYNTSTDTLVVFRIKWNNDCEYEVLKTRKRKRTITDSSNKQPVMEFSNSIPVKVKLIKLDKNYYVFESWVEGVDFVFKDTMWMAGTDQ